MDSSSDMFDSSSSSTEYHAKELERILNTGDSSQNAENLSSSLSSGSIGSDTSSKKRSRLMSKRTFNKKRADTSQSQGNLSTNSQANLSASSLFDISEWDEGYNQKEAGIKEPALEKKNSQGNARKISNTTCATTSNAQQGTTRHAQSKNGSNPSHAKSTNAHQGSILHAKQGSTPDSRSKHDNTTSNEQDSHTNAKHGSKTNAKSQTYADQYSTPHETSTTSHAKKRSSLHAKTRQDNTTSYAKSQTHAKQVSSLNAKLGCRSSAKTKSPVAVRTKASAKKGSQASAFENSLTNAKENGDQTDMEDFRPERICFVVRKKKPVEVTVKSKPVVKKTSQDWKTRKAGVRKANHTTPDLFMPKLTFQRIVREIMQGLKLEYRIQSQALAALQEASEYYLTTEIFEKSTLASSHAKRVTLQIKDIQLVKKIRRIE